MSVRVTFKTNVGAFMAKHEKALSAALEDIGGIWLGKAVLLTPVDSGVLRASIAWAADGETRRHSERYAGNERVPPGVVEYSPDAPANTVRLGSNTEYAIFVHEDLDAYHKVGQAKFIEAPLRQNAEKWVGYIGRKLKAASE